MIELQTLNAVIANRDFSTLVRQGLASVKAFRDYPESFEFIRSHLNQYGELPSVESVIAHTAALAATDPAVNAFEFVETVESIDTLCAKLRERNLKMDVADTLKTLAKDYATLDGYQMVAALRQSAESLHQSAIGNSRGTSNWSTSGAERYETYQQRKTIDFGKTLPALFDEVNAEIGGYELGDVVTIMAFTGRGKSWLGLQSALAANRAGYRTLVESCEMTRDKCMFRLDTLDGGFSNRALSQGTLDDRAETQYRDFTSKFAKGTTRPDLVIRTPEDWPNGLSLAQLEADIDATGCDMVIIDQFNLMNFGGTHRDAKTALSRQLKQLAARRKVVIVILYQTNGDYERSKGTDDSGIRELKLPQLSDYSETIALIQDSSIVYGFDAVLWKDDATGKYRGKALLGILKGRDGGEGTEFELQWMPNDGSIRPRQPTDVF